MAKKKQTELKTVSQFAAEQNPPLSVQTIYNWIKEGKVKSKRIGKTIMIDV